MSNSTVSMYQANDEFNSGFIEADEYELPRNVSLSSIEQTITNKYIDTLSITHQQQEQSYLNDSFTIENIYFETTNTVDMPIEESHGHLSGFDRTNTLRKRCKKICNSVIKRLLKRSTNINDTTTASTATSATINYESIQPVTTTTTGAHSNDFHYASNNMTYAALNYASPYLMELGGEVKEKNFSNYGDILIWHV